MSVLDLDPSLRARRFAEGAADDVAPGRPIPPVALAEHRNHTPFPSQCFQAVDQHGEVFHVVVLRIVFDMTALASDGSLAHAAEQGALAAQDAWSGEPNLSLPLWESDFAPYKPRCDVLVCHAASRPPQPGETRWAAGVAVQWLDEEEDETPREVTALKHIGVTGPRRFKRSGVGAPQAVAEVPIDWRLAAGGIDDPSNPLGIGSGDERRDGQLAPQFEPSIDEAQGAMATQRAVGLGCVARTWLPRRARAGTYDNEWLARQWPLPPEDFDFGYWNCAPDDQQIAFPPPAASVHLLNLHPPLASDAARRWSPPPAGRWSGRLPADEPFVLWRLHSGAMVDKPLNLDTLVVDLQALQLRCTYRAVMSAQAGVRAAETRLNLLRRDQPVDEG